jgi:transposase
MPEQSCYVGLDVYLEQTSICVVNDAGAVVLRGKSPSTGDGIGAVVGKHARGVVRTGLETGLLSTWLFHEPKRLKLLVICIDARHAKAALSLRVNKTDANDCSWYRANCPSGGGIGKLPLRA